jgi:hypothetical protein
VRDVEGVDEVSETPPLDYASPREPKPERMSGCAVAAIGTALSWGPVGLIVAFIAGAIGGKLSESGPPGGPPYPDGGIRAFMYALVTYPIVGVLGTVVSAVVGAHAYRRDGGP